MARHEDLLAQATGIESLEGIYQCFFILHFAFGSCNCEMGSLSPVQVAREREGWVSMLRLLLRRTDPS